MKTLKKKSLEPIWPVKNLTFSFQQNITLLKVPLVNGLTNTKKNVFIPLTVPLNPMKQKKSEDLINYLMRKIRKYLS